MIMTVKELKDILNVLHDERGQQLPDDAIGHLVNLVGHPVYIVSSEKMVELKEKAKKQK